MYSAASAVISACSRSPLLVSEEWHQLEELEHGHDHAHRERPSRKSSLHSQMTIDSPHHNNSHSNHHPDPSHSEAEPRPQSLNDGASTSVAIPLIQSATPTMRPLKLEPLYLLDDMETTGLVPGLKGGRCTSVRSKRVPGGHKAFYMGRRVGVQLH